MDNLCRVNLYCKYLAVITRRNSPTQNIVFGFNILREVLCYNLIKTKIPKANAKDYISDPKAAQSSFETYYKTLHEMIRHKVNHAFKQP